MSDEERKTKSEIVYLKDSSEMKVNPLQRDLSVNKARVNYEDTRDNILFESLFIQKKNAFDLNIDEIFNSDQKKANKNVIRVITSKFHQLFLKYAGENKKLKTELESLKNNKQNELVKEQHNDDKITQKKLSIPNIGNLSLADLNNNDLILPKEEKEKRVFHPSNENNTNDFDEIIMNYLKEDEQECFDQILAEFQSQVNDLEVKEDSLRHEIISKTDEITKLTNEIEELRLSKNLLLQEIQTKNNKVNDFKSMVHSVNFDEMTVKEFKKDDVNINLPLNFDELSGRSNKINKLIEENNFYKEIILKLKEDSFKLETEISQMSVEIENYEKFKNFLLIKNKELENKIIEIKNIMDSLKLKSDKLDYELEEIS